MLTSRRLGSDPQLKKASANSPPLVRGSHGTGVAILQDLLGDLNYRLPKTMARGHADGIYGPETESAVKSFQQASGLKSDGIAGTRTLAALDAVVKGNYRLEHKNDTPDLSGGYW